VSDRTRQERFRERQEIAKVEKEEEGRGGNTVTCTHTTPFSPCLSGWGLNKEREEEEDRQMKSVKRRSVDCSSTVLNPIDCPWGARISQLYIALGPAYNTQRKVHNQHTQKRRRGRHNTKHASYYKQHTPLSTTRHMTYWYTHKSDAYPFLTPFNFSKLLTRLHHNLRCNE